MKRPARGTAKGHADHPGQPRRHHHGDTARLGHRHSEHRVGAGPHAEGKPIDDDSLLEAVGTQEVEQDAASHEVAAVEDADRVDVASGIELRAEGRHPMPKEAAA
jgi:hypothetical protein